MTFFVLFNVGLFWPFDCAPMRMRFTGAVGSGISDLRRPGDSSASDWISQPSQKYRLIL